MPHGNHPPSLATAGIPVPLGPGRWRVPLPEQGRWASRVLYLAEEPRSCLVATVRGRLLCIRARGELSGAATLNLGDCLVRAMTEDMERIILCLGRRETMPAEAISLMESFDRQVTRGNVACRCSIRGTGAGIDALTLAITNHRPKRNVFPFRRPPGNT